MTPENFTYWLQGFFEISDPKKLDENQIKIIKDHLDLVFNKVTPDRNIEHHPQIENYDTLPFEFDLMPKVYCSTSSTFDSPFHNKKVC